MGRSSMPDRKDAMAVLRELLETGKITPIVDSTYPLSEAREAFRHMIEDETQGKVIITPAEAARQRACSGGAKRRPLTPSANWIRQ